MIDIIEINLREPSIVGIILDRAMAAKLIQSTMLTLLDYYRIVIKQPQQKFWKGIFWNDGNSYLDTRNNYMIE